MSGGDGGSTLIMASSSNRGQFCDKSVHRRGQRHDDRQKSGVEFPENHPPFLRFVHDETGRLYVQTYEKAAAKDVYLHDVFDRDGRYIARVPLKSTPVLFRKGKLYSLEESEEGYPVIKRYRVTEASGSSPKGAKAEEE